MATRLSVKANREALYQYLKTSCLDGTFIPGNMLPSVRELSEQHGVTNNAVFQVIQRLTDEGIIYTVPRVGAYVGHPPRETVEPYLSIIPFYGYSKDHYMAQAQLGFEDRIAQLGGHSILLTPEEIRFHQRNNTLPKLSGVFESLDSVLNPVVSLENSEVPRAAFGDLGNVQAGIDCVSFDNFGGGILATRHLWQSGHRNIAFIALHSQPCPAWFSWSAQREQGWRSVLEQGGIDGEKLIFRPDTTSNIHHEEQARTGREAALKIMRRSDITAVVVANGLAAEGMFEAFLQAEWRAENWPVVVCFDAAPGASSSVVSYIRLPWEEIGKEVAQLLWERKTGRLTGPAVERLVPMRLIPRLSCRNDWATSPSITHSRFFGSLSESLLDSTRV